VSAWTPTNTNLTRRLLLLLESREVSGDAHEECWKSVLGRYLDYGVKDYRPPRFLLNDLVRYWRTICVDFEGKTAHAEVGDPKCVARNAKLRTSRKLLFAGGLVPSLLCHLLRADEMRRFLAAWLSATPSDRLAAAFLQFDAVEEGARTFAAYDRWLGIMSDAGARAELSGLTAGTRHDSALWQDIRTIGREFQQGLLTFAARNPAAIDLVRIRRLLTGAADGARPSPARPREREAAALAPPIALAQHLVHGAVAFAARLGFDPIQTPPRRARTSVISGNPGRSAFGQRAVRCTCPGPQTIRSP
jgi:hypothetical protein